MRTAVPDFDRHVFVSGQQGFYSADSFMWLREIIKFDWLNWTTTRKASSVKQYK